MKNRGFFILSALGTLKVPYLDPKGPRMVPKGPRMAPKGPQMVPKCPKMIPKWSPRVFKWSPNILKWSPNAPQGCLGVRCSSILSRFGLDFVMFFGSIRGRSAPTSQQTNDSISPRPQQGQRMGLPGRGPGAWGSHTENNPTNQRTTT